MATPETELSEFAATLTFAKIPENAQETIRRAFFDTIGVTLAGADEGAGEAMFETTLNRADSGDIATMLGLRSGSAAERALRIGTASHALDYDDLSWAMDGHPSVTLIPSLLAIAGERGRQARR